MCYYFPVFQDSHFKITDYKEDDASKNTFYLADAPLFGSTTPSCSSPSVSIPQSSIVSPTSEVSGPFEPVFSKTPNNSFSSVNEEETTSQLYSSEILPTINKTIMDHSDLTSKFNECMTESSRVINDQKEHIIPTQVAPVNTNVEKVVNINYIDKNQKDIDCQRNQIKIETEAPQYQLIGSVKDLTDSNIKETVKQRRISTNTSQTSQNRDIEIKYENPSSFDFPIVRRGPFYQDSFFKEVHQNFQSAVRQVLDRWVDVPSLLSRNTDINSFHNIDNFHHTLSNYRSILDRDSFDDFTCYKSLRSRSSKEENQAATVRDNAEDYKVRIIEQYVCCFLL